MDDIDAGFDEHQLPRAARVHENVPILNLPPELLSLIFERFLPPENQTVDIHRRRFLSHESLPYEEHFNDYDSPNVEASNGHVREPRTRRLSTVGGSIEDICTLRLVCKHFAVAGERLLFSRVVTRFSKSGLKKLETLAGWPRLAKNVRKFSYLVPYLYVDGENHQQTPLLSFVLNGHTQPNLDASGLGPEEQQQLLNSAREQKQILSAREDVRVLKKAIASFELLQHVRLVRAVDQVQSKLLRSIRHDENSRDEYERLWAPSCSYFSRTIGAALLERNKLKFRFSWPMLNLESADFLFQHRKPQISDLAARLTCLTLEFEDGHNIEEKIIELSPLFDTVFTKATGMEAVHVGFPSRPLDLPLATVFHQVKWKNLQTFGIQGWNLDGQEILDLAQRHENLKGLRLRQVHLPKESIPWKDVLQWLRNSMQNLEWLSLTDIGYVRHLDGPTPPGSELPDEPISPISSGPDSDSEEDLDDEPIAGPSTAQNYVNGTTHDDFDSPTAGASNAASYVNGTFHDGFDSDEQSDSENERESEPQQREFVDPSSIISNGPSSWCTCNGYGFPTDADELGDDGYEGSPISRRKRRAWEKWVVRSCPRHSHHDNG